MVYSMCVVCVCSIWYEVYELCGIWYGVYVLHGVVCMYVCEHVYVGYMVCSVCVCVLH